MSKRKQIPASARKPIKRKAKDKPKRPLSAYNFFFKEERQKIVKAVFCEDESFRKKIDPDLTADHIKKLKKENGTVSFEEMGKIIGCRWKFVADTPNRAFHCMSLAKADKERYEKEKKAYDQKIEQMRINVDRSSNTMDAPSHQMHYYMQRQQQGMWNPHGHLNYNNSCVTGTNAQCGYTQMPMARSYNPYNVRDAPHASDHHYGNNAPEQNNIGVAFQQRPRSDNPYSFPIPIR